MPFTSYVDGSNAILNHVTTEWNAQTPPVPVLLYEDFEQNVPDGDTEWARVTVQYNAASQVTLGQVGARRFRRFGLVTISILTPSGDGRARSEVLSDVARDILEGRRTGGEDSVDFRNVRRQDVGRFRAWYQVDMLADFEYDAVK